MSSTRDGSASAGPATPTAAISAVVPPTRSTRASADATRQVGRQARRFGAVGVINTLLDYLLFQALAALLLLPLSALWVAKTLSGAVSTANSFYLNRRWVFGAAHTRDQTGQMIRFLVATCIGVFVVQTGLMQYFSAAWPGLGRTAFEIARALDLVALAPGLLTERLFITTTAFGLATLASMTWNFTTYRLWVFRHPPHAAGEREAERDASMKP